MILFSTRFAEFELDLLALVIHSGAFIANGLQGQALAKGFTDADGIRGFAVHLKNSKAVNRAVGIFAGSCDAS